MLKIINSLAPFFEDNYRRIHIREYARIQKISAPTSSKLLDFLNKENLLKKVIDKMYFYYFANKDSDLFKDYQRIYFKTLLKKCGLIDYINYETLNPVIILFGSTANSEAKTDSDIDIAVFTKSNKKLDIKKFEKKIKREINIMLFKDLKEVPEKLMKNILNGYQLEGKW
jgi:predicted nucleotidyltransferase